MTAGNPFSVWLRNAPSLKELRSAHFFVTKRKKYSVIFEGVFRCVFGSRFVNCHYVVFFFSWVRKIHFLFFFLLNNARKEEWKRVSIARVVKQKSKKKNRNDLLVHSFSTGA